MEIIRVNLQENNFAEAVSVAGLIGCLSYRHAGHAFVSHWERNLFLLESEIPEARIVEDVLAFLQSLAWVQALGKVHQGALTADGLIGLNPLLDCANDGEPSLFKNFSGQVTAAAILSEQVAPLSRFTGTNMAGLLAFSATGIGSWGWDWRTNAHSLDIGFSGNDDDTSKHDPVFVTTELLCLSALSFFVPPWAFADGPDNVSYALWRCPLAAREAVQAIINRLPLQSQTCYRTARRGKSYGKGASYKYFPSATLVQTSSL
jgi:hypothetical protein